MYISTGVYRGGEKAEKKRSKSGEDAEKEVFKNKFCEI